MKSKSKNMLYVMFIIIILILALVVYLFIQPTYIDRVEYRDREVVKEVITEPDEQQEERFNEPDPEVTYEDEPVYIIEQDEYNEQQLQNEKKELGDTLVDYRICLDSDGGKNYYTKGATTGYWIVDIEPFGYPPSTKDDWCIGNVLTEMICNPNLGEGQSIPRMVGATFTCPNGCNNGACICLSSSECQQGYECVDGVCTNL